MIREKEREDQAQWCNNSGDGEVEKGPISTSVKATTGSDLMGKKE